MSEKQADTFLSNVDFVKVQDLMAQTNDNVDQFNKICDKVEEEYTRELDLIANTFYNKNNYYKQQGLYWPTEELEKIFFELSSYLYYMGDKLEQLGIFCDMSKAQKQEVYNRAYLENQQKDLEGKNKRTVAENASVAEEESKYESVVNSMYDRVYKKVKYKIDAAEELLKAISKIISKRMQDANNNFEDKNI